MSQDRRSARPKLAEFAVAELSLGRWSEVEHRLRARLVPLDRAGPISLRPPTPPGFGPAPLAVDVGIEVSGGTVRLDDDLVRSWAVEPRRIWRAAARQAVETASPSALSVRSGPVDLLVVLGDHRITGLVLCPRRLSRLLGRERGPARPGDQGPAGPLIAVAASNRVLVVGSVDDGRPGTAETTGLRTVADRAMDLAADLVSIDEPAQDGLRLPLAPLLLATEGSFPGRWILE